MKPRPHEFIVAYEYLGSGRHRSVWRHGNYVIKVPMCEKGIYDNFHERYVWLNRNANRFSWAKYARCRLIGVILIMEYARYPGPLSDSNGFIPFDKVPDWASYIDCQQVGYNRRGEIVAYDYAY